MTRTLVLAALAAAMGLAPRAQMRVVPVDEEQGHVALGLALRHLGNTGVFMMATAHPDDENNGLLVQLNRGQGYRTALATATRGNGGQNEIGPEIFEALGVLRTEELAALHRFDGAEQYFTRAVDFGYSFSIDETFEKWGRDEIVGDYVRLIRMIRPDVMIGMSPAAPAAGSTIRRRRCCRGRRSRLAGDPTKYPEQLKEGLRPWQPKKYYFTAGRVRPADAQSAGTKTCRLNLAVYDPLLGKTYAEIGTEARSMHKCQGMAQLLALPGPADADYQLVESTMPGQLQRDGNDRSSTASTRASVGLRNLAGNAAPGGSRRWPGRNRVCRPDGAKDDSRAILATPPFLRSSTVCTRSARCAADCVPCRSLKAAATTRFPVAAEGSGIPEGHPVGQRGAHRSVSRRRRCRPGPGGQGVGRGSQQWFCRTSP